MNFNAMLIIPELLQLLIVSILFVQTLTDDKTTARTQWLPWLAGIGVFLGFSSLGDQGTMFWESYRIDGLSQFFKLAVNIGFFVTALNAMQQPELEKEKRADYFFFLALSAWGLQLLASANELITAYIALEISSYSIYALVPLRAERKEAAEAGIKYILFGAVATAIALYGFSYILAAQHTSYISELATKSWSYADSPMACLGLIMFLVGFFYKLALFPFHFWCPDVYDGASNETAAFVATLPKLGAVVILARMAAMLQPGLEITTAIAILGAISMTFGNLSALAQTDIKRLLGYSSVAHAGYITLGLVTGTAEGVAAAAFYALIYILMNLTCFWVLCRISTDGRNVKIDDLRGLHRKAPGLAIILAVSAFALVGLPPTAGFMGKLFLLNSAWNHGYNWLVIVAALNTAISIYYYLNIVRHAYTEAENETTEPVAPIDASKGAIIAGGALALVVLVLGAMPSSTFELALGASKGLMP